MQLKMSLGIEQVLADAQMLVNRLKEHDSAADNLISATQTMYRRIDSMKQYEAGLTQLNEMGRHRPRSNLILALVKENNQIRELQQENKELRSCLEEHQSALELIMSKYREQVVKLLVHKNMHDAAPSPASRASDAARVEKICEMAAVMQRAANMDEESAHPLRERVAQLETENRTLRELLKISHRHSREVTHMDSNIQVDIAPPAPPVVIPTSTPTANSLSPRVAKYSTGDESQEEDSHFVTNDVMNKSVIENEACQGAQVLNSVTKNSSDDNEVVDQPMAASETTGPIKAADPNGQSTADSRSNSDTKVNTADSAKNKLDVSITDEADTTIIDNNDGESSPNATVIDANMVDITISESSGQAQGITDDNVSDNSGSDQSPRAGSQSSSSGSESDKSSRAESIPASGPKKSRASGRKSAAKSGMTTIKRGKGKSILQDMNANTGVESEKSPAKEKQTTAKIT